MTQLNHKIKSADFETQDQRYQELSPLAKDLIQGLIEVDPEKRLELGEARNHPFLCSIPI